MTDGAIRVKQFCDQVLTYNEQYLSYRNPELQLIDELEEGTDDAIEQAREQIRSPKKEICSKLARAKLEVSDLILKSNLPPANRCAMIRRYNRCRSVRYIARHWRPKAVTIGRVYQLIEGSYELMSPYLKKMYPDLEEENT